MRDLVEFPDHAWEVGELEKSRLASLHWAPAPAPKDDLNCPLCQRILEPFNYACDSGIILDKCRHCSGIWLDAGALEKAQLVVGAWE